MNRVETALVNSPPRRWLQRWYEVPTLLRFGGPLSPASHANALARPTYRRLFDHPDHDRFTADQFVGELADLGLEIRDCVTRIRGDYLLSVATKPPAW